MLYQVISATRQDQAAIRALIREVKINPLGLKWQNFKLIKGDNGRLLACGQLKPHRDGSVELASIAVVQSHRRQGLAKQIIDSLLQSTSPPIWLMCEQKIASFYPQFGFEIVTAVDQMPPTFKRIYRLFLLIQKITYTKNSLIIMRCQSYRKQNKAIQD